MSEYLDDASFFLREGSSKIAEDMDKFTCVQSILNIALGVERVLKEILFEINPLYILINPDFKNSAPIFYAGKIIDSEKNNKDIAKNPDGDVLTFSNSLLRACYFSKVTLNNKSLLFKICNYRDIIAHNKLSLIDIAELKLLLQRDLYMLVKEYADELGCNDGKFLSGANVRLAELSASLQVNVAISLRALLNSHITRWNSLKNRPGFIADKDKNTKIILSTENKKETKCPACENKAVIYGKNIFEYNPVTHQEDRIGTKVSALKCQYCKLDITDYKYIDHLGLSKTFDTDDCSEAAETDEPSPVVELGLASIAS